MGEKPKNSITSLADRPVAKGRGYFFARFFGFFFVISSRVLTGIASMRRASSSSDKGGWSVFGFVVMGVSRG